MLASEVSGRGHMGGVESVVLSLSSERLGVLAVSTKMLAIQYRPCFFPPPALMMVSPESGAVARSQVSPWSTLPTSVYALMRAWMLGVCVGLWWIRRVVGHVRRHPALVRHGVSHEVVARLA